MRKTFWSVTYRTWGADRASEAWFDDADKAKEFASHDYRDNTVRHTYSNAAKIKEAESLVRDTELDFALAEM